MRLASFLVSSLSVCGFYLYVLAQLYREEKRQRSKKNSSQSCWKETGPEKRRMAPKRIGDAGIGISKQGAVKDYEQPRFHAAASVALDGNAEVRGRRRTVISQLQGGGRAGSAVCWNRAFQFAGDLDSLAFRNAE